MTRSGNLPLAFVAAITVPLVVVMQKSAGGGDQAGGALALIALPVPLVLSTIWGWAWLVTRSWRPVVPAAAAALAGAALILPGPMVVQAAANVGAGLVAGWALGIRLRPDAALVLCAGILVPMVAWSVHEFPVDEQMALFRQEMTSLLGSSIPSSATPEQREQAQAKVMKDVDASLTAASKIYPAVIAVGLLAEGALILGLVWFFARLTGGRVTARLRFGSFARLRVPFYTIWLLIIGLGLVLTRAEPARAIGWNLALLAGLVVSVQGVAVQVAVMGRILSPLGRMVFWLVMGVFFAPLVVAAGVLLGLADQWLDFRGLNRPENGDEEKVV